MPTCDLCGESFETKEEPMGHAKEEQARRDISKVSNS